MGKREYVFVAEQIGYLVIARTVSMVNGIGKIITDIGIWQRLIVFTNDLPFNKTIGIGLCSNLIKTDEQEDYSDKKRFQYGL